MQWNWVTGHLSEGSFVRNVLVQIPKFDAKPSPNPNPMPVLFGQMTLRTSELLPWNCGTCSIMIPESIVNYRALVPSKM